MRGFFMADLMPDRLIKFSQEMASDLLKRRWPNRYIGKPIVSIDDCVSGLIEIGAIQNEVLQHTSKKMALCFWVLKRIESKSTNQKVEDASFYKSSAWRKIRFSVLRGSDYKCCLCGASKESGAVLHVDHIKPRSKYPALALEPENLRVLCDYCNIGKSDSD